MRDESDVEEYDICDNCGAYGTLIPCPGLEYEVKHGILKCEEICEDCCEYNFETYPWGCICYADECTRARKMQLETLEKIVKEKGFEKWPKLDNVYLNSEKIVAIGTYPSNPEKIIKDSVQPLDALYVGNKYGLAKTEQKKHAYSKGFLDEVLKILKKLGEDDLTYEIFSKSGILNIKGYYVWGLIADLTTVDWAYFLEKNDFITKVKDGYAIFEEDIRNELAIYDLHSNALDWTKLTPKQFEELCADILDSHESFQECFPTGGSGDEGRDIKAKEKIQTITGLELRKWCIQCKHFLSRPLSRKDIDDLNTLHTRFKFDVFCIMTSSTLAPGAIRLLEEYEKQSNYEVKMMDKYFLEKLIRENSHLAKKFFGIS